MGDWDNPPLFAVKKVAVVVLIIVVLVIVYSIYSQLQLYISYVCIYIYIMQWDSLDTQSESFILIYL